MRNRRRSSGIAVAMTLCLSAAGAAQTVGYTAVECPSCAEWNEPTRPVRLYGNTWYVGTRGLGAILITSPEGHILLDGGLPESAPHILRSIREAGFRIEDLKGIGNSHAHYDHAGGIAALQKASGADVAAMPGAAEVLRTGRTGPDDPQHEVALPYPAIAGVRVIRDGDAVRVGDLTVVAHQTAGHAPGGTSWSWRSCEDGRCLDFVYADSQTPVSDDSFTFSGGTRYREAVQDFRRGFDVLERLPCDVLLTPHPGASRMWQRLEKGTAGLVDGDACRAYATNAREQLDRRLSRERGGS